MHAISEISMPRFCLEQFGAGSCGGCVIVKGLVWSDDARLDRSMKIMAQCDNYEDGIAERHLRRDECHENVNLSRQVICHN